MGAQPKPITTNEIKARMGKSMGKSKQIIPTNKIEVPILIILLSPNLSVIKPLINLPVVMPMKKSEAKVEACSLAIFFTFKICIVMMQN